MIPQEAGLNERAVSFEKGCYVGQETVARLYFRGKPNRHLRGLRLSAAAPPGAPLRLGERQVGTARHGRESPRLGPIALAIVRREAAPGGTVEVGDDGVSAEVVELPFARRKLVEDITERSATWPRTCSSSPPSPPPRTTSWPPCRNARTDRGPGRLHPRHARPHRPRGRDAPELEAALVRWRDAGLKATGTIGDADPVQAVAEVCPPGSFDEVIVSTLPGQTSRWLRSDVPYRIGRLTDLPVTHVIAMTTSSAHATPPPERERAGA